MSNVDAILTNAEQAVAELENDERPATLRRALAAILKAIRAVRNEVLAGDE